MPPRSLPLSLTSTLIPSTRTQTQHITSLIQSRQFSASPSHQQRKARTKRFTRQRRRLFHWLDTVGAQLKFARSDRTINYLGSVGRDGPEEKNFNLSNAARGQEGGASSPDEEIKPQKDEDVASDNLDPFEAERRDAERNSDRGSNRGRRPQREEPRLLRPADFQPFPLNQKFKSEPVLSEDFREMIYVKVVEKKVSVRAVSVEHNVTMERVGAVVRMKQMERDWLQQRKPLATFYSRAVLDMLPRTEWSPRPRFDSRGQMIRLVPHESINDLPVHPATTQQIFHPVAESRRFTRADAGRAFHPKLLSADERIPHPQLVEIEKFKMQSTPSTPALRAFSQEFEKKEKAATVKFLERQKKREKNVQVYQGKKYDFKFEDVSVDSVGKDGRARAGVGWRYGMPHEDRKPGQVKIPTRV